MMMMSYDYLSSTTSKLPEYCSCSSSNDCTTNSCVLSNMKRGKSQKYKQKKLNRVVLAASRYAGSQ